jgi:hypothetical protein
MIDLELQRDSHRRLSEIKQDIEKAKQQGKAAIVRQLTKELQEEQKILKLIERVEVAA